MFNAFGKLCTPCRDPAPPSKVVQLSKYWNWASALGGGCSVAAKWLVWLWSNKPVLCKLWWSMIMQLQAALQLEQLQGLLCRLRLIAAGSSINGYHQLIPRSTSVKLEKNPTQHQILSSKLNTEDYYFRCCRWKLSLSLFYSVYTLVERRPIQTEKQNHKLFFMRFFQWSLEAAGLAQGLAPVVSCMCLAISWSK